MYFVILLELMYIGLSEYRLGLADHTNINSKMILGDPKGRSQEIDLLSLSLNNYVYHQSHPALHHLQLNLAGLIAKQYGDHLEPTVTPNLY